MNQDARYLNQRSFSSKLIVRTQRHTHPTYCSTWTTKMIGKSADYVRNFTSYTGNIHAVGNWFYNSYKLSLLIDYTTIGGCPPTIDVNMDKTQFIWLGASQQFQEVDGVLVSTVEDLGHHSGRSRTTSTPS